MDLIDNVAERSPVHDLKRAGVEHATMDLGHLRKMWLDRWDCRPPRFEIGGIRYDADAEKIDPRTVGDPRKTDEHIREGTDRFAAWGQIDDPTEDNPRKEALERLVNQVVKPEDVGMGGEGVSIFKVMQIVAGEEGLMIQVEGSTTDREINVYTIFQSWDKANPTTLTDWQEAMKLPTGSIDTTH